MELNQWVGWAVQLGIMLFAGGGAWVSVKKDIQYLHEGIEQLREEARKSNDIKNRLAYAEASTCSAHHRLDTVEGRLNNREGGK